MLWLFLGLLAVHWFADFVCQTHWQASNKSKRCDALAAHVAVYSLCLLFAVIMLFPVAGPIKGFGFVGLNAALHFATDFVTSRINSRLYAAGRTHDFFVSVGFDQLIHQVTLALTMKVFFGWT